MKKILPFVQSYKVTLPLHHPKNNFMSKWHLIQPLQRLGAKIFSHVSHSTELVCMCLACQHFDFNSADWISDNLHVISSQYVRTMGKKLIFQFSRRSWGRNAWVTLRTSAWEASNVFPFTDFFCKTKKKLCIVRTRPKLYTCVTLLCKGTTGETGFPKLSHLGSIIST